jgi:uncharacterized metal-binding protein
MTFQSDGSRHEFYCLFMGTGVALSNSPWGFNTFTWIEASIFWVLIMVWGFYFSPDLDLSDGAWKCKAWHRWKRLRLGWFWIPYGMLFKHRSGWSHSLLPGTAVRLGYALIPLVLIGAALFQVWSLIRNPLFINVWLLIFLIGQAALLADLVHLTVDALTSKPGAKRVWFIWRIF